MSPVNIVRDTLLAALPNGVPPSFKSIEAARSEGTGRRQTITASLTMFDGLPATVRLSQWRLGWSYQFTEMVGGAASFADGKWSRLP